jgi:hypothetical protein
MLAHGAGGVDRYFNGLLGAAGELASDDFGPKSVESAEVHYGACKDRCVPMLAGGSS